MKYLPFTVCLFVCLLSSLCAEVISLKGANGKEAKFTLEAVSAEGVQVLPQNGYKSILINWEQLDLAWLKQNQPDLWKQKQQVEVTSKRAFEAFYFGQSRNDVIREINRIKAVEVPGQSFGDAAASVFWVSIDPDSLRRFMRFHFDENERLRDIEVHMSFDEDEAIEKGMKTEWERLIRMVDSLGVHPIQRDRFPTSSSWRQFVRATDTSRAGRLLTRNWSDASRQIELSLETKQVELSAGESKPGKVTFFGVEIDTSSVVSTGSNTNWVVYKAYLK